MRYLFAVLALAALSSAMAEGLYNCKREGGGFAYTSFPAGTPVPHDCKRLPSYEPKSSKSPATMPVVPVKQNAVVPVASPKKVETPKAPANKAAVKKTIVPTKAQDARNEKRVEILAYEIKRELATLRRIDDTIQNTPAEQGKQLALLKNRRKMTLLNIKAIEQELSRLGFRVSNSSN